MKKRVRVGIGVVILCFVVIGGVGVWSGEFLDSETEATVTFSTSDGSQITTLSEIPVADTPQERIVGLSETESLRDGEGMVFLYSGEGERDFVMRGMEYPLDIVFVGADGDITSIVRADVPSKNGDLEVYRGTAKIVVEVPRGYTDRAGIEVGDSVTVS